MELWIVLGARNGRLSVRNQEKRVPAKRGFLQHPVSRPTKQKLPKDIGPSSTFGTQTTAAKRGVHSCKKNLILKKPCLGSETESGKEISEADFAGNHSNSTDRDEQRHLYAKKAKTEMCHSCLKDLKRDIHTCKTR